MRHLYPIFLIFFFWSGKIYAQSYDAATINYFQEVALQAEYGLKNKKIRCWAEDVKIYVSGEKSDFLMKELKVIVQELNALIQPIEITFANSLQEANFHLFLGSYQTYIKTVEPGAQRWAKGNLGFFYVYTNKKSEIYKGSMYLDIVRLKAKDTLKHLLREELTQALGLMNDSMKYRESIFYQKWTRTLKYAAIDKKLIQILYNSSVKPGMNAQQVAQVLHK